ncbi:MAG: hypothetical protein KH899_01950 [Haemophilus pittmaniae]|uniref:hypothetical protein n=1 Tax=Haemophilus pittmaniae TaxID=249188 RepID=UPI0023F40FEA|nr:hypothetical protein [Haemophilus pittmaniae]MBS6026356.1 hypothetical protein [Haemophilus pittmaniae]
MSYPFIDLDKSKKGELITHLKENCGIEKKDTDSKDELINAVLEFEENAGLIRPAELMPNKLANGEGGEKMRSAVVFSSNLNDYPKVRIKIHSGHEAGGEDDVLLWLNGRSFQIKRECEVEVPKPVYKLLLDSQTIIEEQDKNGENTKRRTVQNYNISFLGDA